MGRRWEPQRGGASRVRGAAGQDSPRWEQRGHGHGSCGCLAQYKLARVGNSGDSPHTVMYWAEAPAALAHTRVCLAGGTELCFAAAWLVPSPVDLCRILGAGGCSPGVPGATAALPVRGQLVPGCVLLLGCFSRRGTVRSAPGHLQSAVLQPRGATGTGSGAAAASAGQGTPGWQLPRVPTGTSQPWCHCRHLLVPGSIPAIPAPPHQDHRLGVCPPRLLVLHFSGMVVFSDVAVD